ncbi:MAG: ATP-binding protein [Proteobacteria bacterium]|nr:ATP-binding protein [Pseudomonadota bacterium]
MPYLKKNFGIVPLDFVKAGEISIQVHGLLKTIGFEAALIRRVSVCAYESEMNVVMHGGDGTLSLSVDSDSIVLEVRDEGPGIENIDLALKEGYSTATEEIREMGFGAGMGLPNIQKNADAFEIHSEKGRGTHLKMSFNVKSRRE